MLASTDISNLSFNAFTELAMLVLLLPLFTFFLLLFFGRKVEKGRGEVASAIMFLAFCVSVYLTINTWQVDQYHARWEWFRLSKKIILTLGVQLDNLSSFMLIVVTGVSFLVHLFSLSYMKGEDHLEKYFGYLGLFTFSMLGIVLSDNLFSLFIFWELVGLSSYLLIGFYFKKDTAVYANKKAFVANRVGDAGFLFGILMLWANYQTLDLETLTTFVGVEQDTLLLSLAGFGIFCGAVGKSAQFPLQVWLPNAMEGPTPVSALIHAATMVAAGVYLIARTYFLMQPDVLTVIAIIGTITAFIGAVTALAQTDIKRVLAFSTISQLGYMMMGMGVGAYDAALFHLLTHAFFKACLFLSSGAVIHAMHRVEHELHHNGSDVHFDVQDMRQMGGLRKKMPLTFIAYAVATFALAGLPFTSGFLSKDAILNGAFSWAQLQGGGFSYLIPLLGFVSAFLTAFYMGRQMFLVFFGDFKLELNFPSAKGAYEYVKESPLAMLIPLFVLGTLSLGIVFSLNPLDGTHSWFLEGVHLESMSLVFMETMHHNHLLVSIVSVVLGLSGLFLAYLMYYKKSIVTSSENPVKKVLTSLSLNHWFLDDFVNKYIVKMVEYKANYFHQFDSKVIDRLVNVFAIVHVVGALVIGQIDKYIVDGSVNGVASLTGGLGKVLRLQHSGKVQSYIALTALFIISIIVFIIIRYS